MRYRIHTAEAREVQAQFGTDAQIDDALGGYEHGESTEQRLIINDMSGLEAFVLTGTVEDFRDLAERIQHEIDWIESFREEPSAAPSAEAGSSR
jgi:hypothetical protein